jgi:ribosomal protein S6
MQKADKQDLSEREYELAFLLSDPAAAEEIEQTLRKKGAAISYANPAILIKLAYPIAKQTNAYFGFYHFRAEREKISEMREALRQLKAVQRFLITTPPLKPFTRQSKPQRPASPLEQPKPAQTPEPAVLTNEALEQTIVEILK